MARKVFFSFHFSRDSWRVGQVRNSWVVRRGEDASPFLDKAQWESIERQGKQAIQNWIDTQMKGTSVTVVLIGAATAGREWVQYEIRKSHADGKGMLGIYIHNLQNPQKQTDFRGQNPFELERISVNGVSRTLASYYPTYDWANDDGYNNMPAWIEAAAQKAGR